MSAEPISSGVRTVLDAPRGRRFSHTRTGKTPPTREQRLLAQMEGNPRVAYRQTHGPLPAWMHLHAARLAFREAQTSDRPRKPTPAPKRPAQPMVPRPRPAPDDGPPPPRPRPARPPLPKRPRSHRKPRRRRSRADLHLLGYTLAFLAGALAHHLTQGLF